MKPILLLGPEQAGAPALERGRLDLCRVPPSAEVMTGAGAYDSVIVINDGGADTIRRVQLALDMRARGGGLTIGVLTYLAAPELGVAVTDVAVADWLALWPHLRIELKEAVLSLEYQAD